MWKFYKSATNETNWPNEPTKEVCFIGRSNVGKSSLINALANAKIARTSNTPGRTQLINFFYDEVGRYVDLPGYGYAKVPKKIKDQMFAMIENYFNNRHQLIKIFLLIDAKVGPTNDDLIIADFFKKVNKSFMVILTKSDKANQSQLHKSCERVKLLSNDYISVSSLKGQNIAKLNRFIKTLF